MGVRQAGLLVADSTASAAGQSALDNEPDEEEDTGLGYDETATASVRTSDPPPPSTQASGESAEICNQHLAMLLAIDLQAPTFMSKSASLRAHTARFAWTASVKTWLLADGAPNYYRKAC